MKLYVTRYRWSAVLMLAAAAFLSPVSSAMSFDVEPPILYLSGRVVTTDWPMWERAMARFELDTIVFGHSPGGDSQTGRRIGNEIRSRGMKTVVAGRCMSACANMFLGGVERQFIKDFSAQPTVLGYHGTYRRTGEHLDRGVEYFLSMADGKLTEALAKSFAGIDNRRGALYFIHRDQRANDTQALAYFCDGEEADSKRDEQCKNMAGVDALSSGILTTWGVRDIPVPSSRPVRRQLDRGPTVKSWRD